MHCEKDTSASMTFFAIGVNRTNLLTGADTTRRWNNTCHSTFYRTACDR
jgi:hypothetical protein